MDSAVIDLPQPDSPSNANVSPLEIVRFNPSIARTDFLSVYKMVSRLSISNNSFMCRVLVYFLKMIQNCLACLISWFFLLPVDEEFYFFGTVC